MAELIDIQRVVIGPQKLTARVRIADDAPLMTSEDLDATTRVYRLLPHIVEHACMGDAGETFRDAMGDTEIAHLLEHVAVELLAQTDLAGDIPAGRTWVDEVAPRTFDIELTCQDDVLVAAALSCGVWVLDWAYRGGEDPKPDVDAIVAGLVELVEQAGEGEDLVEDIRVEEPEAPVDDDEPAEEDLASEEEDLVSEEPLEVAADADVAAEDEAQQEAESIAAEPAPEVVTIPDEPQRPLWTPAPEVPTSARRARRFQTPRSPEVEAEIDQIMATIEMPVQDSTD